jgi:hypothetical protein
MELSRAPEVIVPLPAPSRVAHATKFRSTWLASSVQALRERGLFERYVATLSPAFRDAITSCVAGVWLPLPVAMAHYEACDRLDLSVAEQVALGAQVTRHTQRTVISMAVRLASAAGGSPWTVMAQAQRIWDRNWIGGAVGVVRIGEREAQIEVVGWPCARFAYCRVASRGILVAVTELCCDKASVSDIPSLYSHQSLGFRVAWY